MATIIKVGNGRCDARCHEAKKPECDCVCGGRYHGALLQGSAELERRLKTHHQWALGGVNEGDIINAQTPLFAEDPLPKNEKNWAGDQGGSRPPKRK